MKNRFLFKDLKKILISRYGKDIAEKIWEEAEQEYRRFDKMLPDVKGDGQMMLPVAAYYSTLREVDPENALPLLCEYGTQTGLKLKKWIHGITSIPGVPALLWRNMPMLMDKSSSAKKGYTRRMPELPTGVAGVDILTCPIHDVAVKLGMPEAARIVCAMDKQYMNGIKNIDYVRTMSVAEGGECCDYRLSFNKRKK